jgi:hypothetical protein
MCRKLQCGGVNRSANVAGSYAEAVPLLRAAVAKLFTDDAAAPVDIPSTILGWFAADDVWDEQGRRAMFERAQALERRVGALGAMRITLAGLSVSQAWAGQMDEAENSYGEAAEISALIGVPPPATTVVLLEVRAWQGREDESRAVASSTAQWGRDKGASILEIFALMGLTVLELGLGRYPEALGWGLQIFDDDPPGFGNRILPDVVEAGVRGGDRKAAEGALARLTERATASGSPWALGLMARSTALMASDADAETHYQEAIRRLSETAVRTELARARICSTANGFAAASVAATPTCSCGPPTACSPRWEPSRSPNAHAWSNAPPVSPNGIRRTRTTRLV